MIWLIYDEVFCWSPHGPVRSYESLMIVYYIFGLDKWLFPRHRFTPPLHHQQQHHISQMAANDLHQSQQHMIDWYTAEEVFSASPHTQTTNVASQGAITVDGYAPITTDNVYFLSNALSHTELGFLAADEHNVIHLRRQCETFVHFARGRPSKRQFHSIFFLFFCSAIEFLFFLVL